MTTDPKGRDVAGFGPPDPGGRETVSRDAKRDRRGFRLTPQALVGLCIVVFGLILTGDNLGWLDADRWLRFYPFVIVLFGLVKALSSRTRSGQLFGGVFVLIGLALAVEILTEWHIHIWDWWPLALVALGLVMVLRTRQGRHDGELGVSPGEFSQTAESSVSAFAFWSGVRRRVASPAFRRADLTAIMGGVELDLRPATTAGGEAVIDVFAMWGGVEITVPADWHVVNEAMAIMGGIDDKSTGSQGAQNRLVLRGFAIMGGVDIKT